MKLSKAIDIFLKEQEFRGNSIKTISVYKQQLRYFYDFTGNVDCFELTYSMVQDYTIYLRKKIKNSNHPYGAIRNEKISDVTVQTYVRGLKSFINFCIENKYIEKQNFEYFRLHKAGKVIIEILSDAEIKQLFTFCDKNNNKKIALRNKLIISLMVDCGLRVNEVATLLISNIKLKENILKVCGKGNKERNVPFGDHTKELLKIYIHKYTLGDDLLFINEYGNPVGYFGIKKLFEKLRKYTGNTKLHPHLLRHTFATKYLMNGGDITSLKMILGHTSLKMVEHYLHLAEQYTVNRYKQYSVLDNMGPTDF